MLKGVSRCSWGHVLQSFSSSSSASVVERPGRVHCRNLVKLPLGISFTGCAEDPLGGRWLVADMPYSGMAGLAINPVQVFRTCRDLHWEFLRLWTGFELPSSWADLPCYGLNLNRNILDFMRWPQIYLGE